MLQLLKICQLAIFFLLYSSDLLCQAGSIGLDLNRSPPKSPVEEASKDIPFTHAYHRFENATPQDTTVKKKYHTRYAVRKKSNPNAIKRQNERGRERRKKRIAEMKEEELLKNLNNKREKEKIRYHARKKEGGVASQYERK